MKVKEMQIADLIPYENNPRKNEDAVDAVAASLKEFGYHWSAGRYWGNAVPSQEGR